MLAIQNKKEQPIGTGKKSTSKMLHFPSNYFFPKSKKSPFTLTPTGFSADPYRNKML